jgi:hypothetical protein
MRCPKRRSRRFVLIRAAIEVPCLLVMGFTAILCAKIHSFYLHIIDLMAIQREEEA